MLKRSPLSVMTPSHSASLTFQSLLACLTIFPFLYVLFSAGSFSSYSSLTMMAFYDSAFLMLVAGCGILSWRQYYNSEKSPEEKSLTQSMVTPRAKAEASQFTHLFLTVYCLVMGSDWLQGMHSSHDSTSDESLLIHRTQGLTSTVCTETNSASQNAQSQLSSQPASSQAV